MMKVRYRICDGDECVADVDASGTPLRSYAWGPGIDNLLSMIVFLPGSTNTYYAVKDHLGSVHALVNEQGEVVESFSCDAWGNVQSAVGSGQSATGNRYLFQGREYSFATGLYSFRARWYEPRLGRWLSNDPIGISGGLNLYAFCGNDPVNYVDPWGNDEYEVDWIAHPGWVHVDRYANTHGSHGKRGSYQLSGTPVKDAPPIPKRDLPAFQAAAKRGLRFALKTGAKFAGIALALYTPDSLADGELPEEVRIKPILILPGNPFWIPPPIDPLFPPWGPVSPPPVVSPNENPYDDKNCK